MVALPVADRGTGVLLLLHDVTAREQLEARLTEQAFTDDLTKLGNRRFFLERTRLTAEDVLSCADRRMYEAKRVESVARRTPEDASHLG